MQLRKPYTPFYLLSTGLSALFLLYQEPIPVYFTMAVCLLYFALLVGSHVQQMKQLPGDAWLKKTNKALALYTGLTAGTTGVYLAAGLPVFPVGYSLAFILGLGFIAMGWRYQQGCTTEQCTLPKT